MDDCGVSPDAPGEGRTSTLFFKNEAQRRIIEILGQHRGEEVFLPYLEVMLKKPKEQFACDLCKLAQMGLIEEVETVDPSDTLYRFILNFRLTPMGQLVYRRMQI